MTQLEEIQQKLREDFARSGGLARARKLSAKRRKEIATVAGKAPKKRKAKK